VRYIAFIGGYIRFMHEEQLYLLCLSFSAFSSYIMLVIFVIGRVLEVNVVRKDWRKVDLRFAFVYPNVYRVGMSSFATQLLYFLLNSREDVVCERCFLPYQKKIIPSSLESRRNLREFDVVGFSLQFETDYVNVVDMLRRSGIPLHSKDRSKEDPLIIAGGPCAWENPEPISDFIDLFVIGDAEAVMDRFIDLFLETRNPRENLEVFADIEGVYVPSLGRHYVKRAWVKSLDDCPHPVAEIVPQVDENSPFAPVFGKSFLLEVVRGCNRGCRFCLIGFQNRPMRIRGFEVLKDLVDRGPKFSRVRKVSLIGSAISDHPDFEDLCWYIVNSGFEISVPSLRIDGFSESIAEALVKGGQKTVTFAPEAGTFRLRKVVKKPFTEEQILYAVATAKKCGIKHVKLYFVIGLPGEDEDDLRGIVDLIRKVINLGYSPSELHVSFTPFIPKPHTPFQWLAQFSLKELDKRLKFITKNLKALGLNYVDYLDPRWAKIQAALSLGDRKLGKIIEYVVEHGGGLGAWRRAQKTFGINLTDYSDEVKDLDKELPWSHINVGVDKIFLIGEYERSLEKNKNE